jgi:hypothetical protein
VEMTIRLPESGIMMSRRDHPSGNCKGDPGREEEPWPSWITGRRTGSLTSPVSPLIVDYSTSPVINSI